MRKHTTIDLDQDLVRQAATVLGTTKTTDTVHAALADVVRRQRRLGLFEIAHDLDLAALDALRSDRVERNRMRSPPGNQLGIWSVCPSVVTGHGALPEAGAIQSLRP